MATKKIGKLTYKFSPDGLLFRWGDEGEVKRVNLGPLNKLIDRGNSGEGGYPDDGYDDERGYDDVYDRDPYDDGYDRVYDDERYDDGYDDRYDDRRDDRYDDGYDYDRRDDRYDDGYEDDRYRRMDDDEPYYEPGYEDEQAPSKLDAIWDLLDRYPWIVYILLVLLPPLGIYLLWRKDMFDFTVRTAISVVSGIWFVVLIIWLISALTGGAGDTTTQNGPSGINLASPTATIAPAPTDEPLSDSTADPGVEPSALPDDMTSAAPSPTALVNIGEQPGVTNDDATGGYVYSPTTGAYYHKTSTCTSIGTAAVTQVALEVAQSRNQSQCPVCYGSTTYYMNDGGKYYHASSTCTNMTSAEACTKEVALKAGKTACPECIREFYISSVSPYYHSKSNCSGITNASQTTINSATAAGKTACPTCIGTAKPSATAAASTDYSKPLNKYDAGVTVYAKKGGSNYHRSSVCTGSGMTGGQKITLYNAIDLGYTACKYCLPDGNDTIYCDKNRKAYHSTSSCTAAKDVVKTALGKALAMGVDKCPKCWSSSNSSTNAGNVAASGPKVYITDDNNLYHTRKACNGMSDPTKIALSQALAMGKDACNDCAGQANKTVYATAGSAVYHYASNCSKLNGKASKATLARALADELSACPTCVKNETSNDNKEEVEDGILDKSGISVYITNSGDDYHSSTSCSELGAEEYYKVSLGVADANGKDPCKKCCATASHRIYSSATDTRYHFDKNCSLLPGAVKSASLARALMDGLKACPACTRDDDDKASISATPAPDVVPLSESKSGKKVYVTQSGKNYHINKNCSKIATYDVKGVSLETAKNYSMTACSVCSDIAKTKVYGNDASKFYHVSNYCLGVKNDESGTLEKALLAGLKACPVCIQGNDASGENADAPDSSETTPKPESGEDTVVTPGSASGSTKVWIDLSDNSEIYHKTSKCSGIEDGVGVTLSYVLDMDFDPCPKCDPPTKAN